MSEEEYHDNEVKKHFDFKLRGSLDGSEYSHNDDFAYAYYRDEMKERNLNPDINIEQEDNQNNLIGQNIQTQIKSLSKKLKIISMIVLRVML